MRSDDKTLMIADRLYRLLLYVYPAPFRRRFGLEMAQVFRDDMRGTMQRDGLLSASGLWLITFLDLIKTAFIEHIWEIFNMPLEKLTRWSGLAAALGAPLFLLTFGSHGFWRTYGALGLPDGNYVHPILAGIGLLLMGLGLYGLYRQLPPTLASKLGLALAIVGVSIGILGMITWNQAISESLILPAFILPEIGLAVMGVVALTNRSLGRLSFVPLAIVAGGGGLLITAADGAGLTRLATQVFLMLSCAGWIALGAAMILNQPEEPVEPGLLA